MARNRAVAKVAAGRYWRERDARVVVEAWRRSGENLSQFARHYGIAPQRLVRWWSRLEQEQETEAVQFHPVQLVDGAASSGQTIEIDLVDGRRVRVPHDFVAEDLRRVLTVLEEAGRC